MCLACFLVLAGLGNSCTKVVCLFCYQGLFLYNSFSVCVVYNVNCFEKFILCHKLATIEIVVLYFDLDFLILLSECLELFLLLHIPNMIFCKCNVDCDHILFLFIH
jgi:hypothetical protein